MGLNVGEYESLIFDMGLLRGIADVDFTVGAVSCDMESISEREKMKRLKVGANEYFWNEFFDFIFLPVGPNNTKERIYKSDTKKYKDLASRHGWSKVS